MSATQNSPPLSATAITSVSAPRACARHDLARLDVREGRRAGRAASRRARTRAAPRHGPCPAPSRTVDVLCAPVEHHDGRLDVARIGLAVDERRARRGAAADLVLEAGPRAVGEERVLAAAQPEQLLQLVQRLVDRARRRVRAEQAPGKLARAAVEGEPRKLVRGQVHVGKALVVAQDDVEARPVALDEVVLEQQRLGFRIRHRDFDVRRLRAPAPAPSAAAGLRGSSCRRAT